MAPLDSATDLPDLDPDHPTGPNLEFDADFIELERLVQGKPEQQYGTLVVAAEEPDWKGAIAKAAELLTRTYDLRVMAQLAMARLHQEGVVSYAATLAMIRTALETRWAAVHPQLDPEDDNDPTLRANGLLSLGEPGRVMQLMRIVPLARSSRAGTVCWRDITISTGAMEAEPGAEKVSEATIAAAFRETDQPRLAALRGAVGSAERDVIAISAVFEREAGYGTGPDFTEFAKLLKEIGRAVDKYRPVEADPVPLPEPDEAARADHSPPARAAGATAASLTAITSREDAMRLLDLVVGYYEQHEPSSPLPLLIGRARRLADKGFMDVLRDLAPDGVSQAQTIVGQPPE